MLITNNEGFQITTAKSMPLNNGVIYALENIEFFSPVIFIKYLYSCKSKHINKNKDNNKLFNPIILTKCLYGCRNKHIGKNSKNLDLKSQSTTALSAVSTKCLAKQKAAHAIIYSNLSKKTKTLIFVTTT